MSLVNDLLQDLEVRQYPAREAQPPPATDRVEINRPLPKALLLSLLVVALAPLGYWLAYPTPKPMVLPAPKLATIPSIPRPTAAPEPPAIQPVPAELVPPPAATPHSPPAGAQDKIQTLLADARAALAADRLTTPVDDNAYSRYQTVLYLEPGNAPALDGIKRVVARYLALHRQALDSKAPRLATTYVDKARRIGRLYPPVERWLAEELEALAQSESASDSAAATRAEPQPPAVQHSPAYRQEQIVERARHLLDRGRWTEAEQLLARFIQEHPDRDTNPSKIALLELYLASGDLGRAGAYLQSLHFLSRDRRVFFQSRLLVQRGEFEAALALLREHTPALSAAPEYHALAAALSHQLGDYEKAAETYRELLNEMPHQGTYWLGLAVSLDALDDSGGALHAFHNARLYGEAEAETRGYIDERIRALSR